MFALQMATLMLTPILAYRSFACGLLVDAATQAG
jgi:hypothetical protein